jgi:hypothetical protein
VWRYDKRPVKECPPAQDVRQRHSIDAQRQEFLELTDLYPTKHCLRMCNQIFAWRIVQHVCEDRLGILAGGARMPHQTLDSLGENLSNGAVNGEFLFRW